MLTCLEAQSHLQRVSTCLLELLQQDVLGLAEAPTGEVLEAGVSQG